MNSKKWPMTEIHQIDLTKRSLAAMPDAERKLLLLLGHATNEINVFQKLVLMSGQGTYAPRFVDHIQAGQTLILMRTLIGKLCEAWDLFKVRFLSERQLAELYLPKLNAEALTALESLKKHFGTQSPLMLIRSRFSFHYRDDNNLVEQSFQEIPADEAWQFYLSNIEGNCFFYASELVVQSGVIKLAICSGRDIGEAGASDQILTRHRQAAPRQGCRRLCVQGYADQCESGARPRRRRLHCPATRLESTLCSCPFHATSVKILSIGQKRYKTNTLCETRPSPLGSAFAGPRLLPCRPVLGAPCEPSGPKFMLPSGRASLPSHLVR
jgi:hypothetical protein